MTDHASNLRSTRADMLGTDDEGHYFDCHNAAVEIEHMQEVIDKVALIRLDLEVENSELKGRLRMINDWAKIRVDDRDWLLEKSSLSTAVNRQS